MQVRLLHKLYLLAFALTCLFILIFDNHSKKRLSHVVQILTHHHQHTFSESSSLISIIDQRRKELSSKSFCARLLHNNASELARSKAILKNQTQPAFEKRDIDRAKQLKQLAESNCFAFKTQRGYFTVPTSPEERDFPITFSILMYKHVSQAERLLRAIYSPHNYYCLHVDHKATQLTHDAMQAIAFCLPNVFIVPNPESVKWGQISLVDAERKCMRQLVRRSRKWRYFINLTGEEFPLWSNRQLVRILKAYNGSNDVEVTTSSFSQRYSHVWRNGRKTATKKKPPPKNLTIYKGEIHIVVTRGFVELALNDKNQLAADLFRWLRDVHVPDEFYYTTLNYNAQVFKTPGGFPKDLLKKKDMWPTYNARFKLWYQSHVKCDGRWQREVCVLGVGDLWRLTTAPQLFINKFDITIDPLAFDCAEYFQLNRTFASALPDFSFDTTFYSNLPAVKARKNKLF